MSEGIWMWSKSCKWYKANTDKELREFVRKIANMKEVFIPCKDLNSNNVYLLTNEIESIKQF